MSKSNNKVNETKEFLDALLIGRDNNALGEFPTPDCLALTDYGIAFGRDEIAMDLSFYFQSIDVRSLDFLQQAHCADTTVLQFSENCEHIGEFCGIETTGKKFIFNASIMLRWQVCIRMIVNGHSHYREQIFSRRGDILPNCSR